MSETDASRVKPKTYFIHKNKNKTPSAHNCCDQITITACYWNISAYISSLPGVLSICGLLGMLLLQNYYQNFRATQLQALRATRISNSRGEDDALCLETTGLLTQQAEGSTPTTLRMHVCCSAWGKHTNLRVHSR